ANTAPSMLPSRCSAPTNSTSPRIVVPRAIRLVSPDGPWWRDSPDLRGLLLNMIVLHFLECVAPIHLPDGGFVLRRIGLDTDAIGGETFGQHQRAVHLLEIAKLEVEAVGL